MIKIRTLPVAGLLALVFLGLCAPARAAAPECEAMAARLGADLAVPEGLLAAIARTESGGGPRPSAWPWTLNIQGRGHYFATREEALQRLRATVASGIRNVDVGCMQINFRWHGEQFATLEEMIEPARNIAYAASYLRRLRDRSGDWQSATRHYHSRDPERGAAYLGRVRRNAERVAASGTPAPEVQAGASPAAMPRTPGGLDLRFGTQRPLSVGLASRGPASPAEMRLVPAQLAEGQRPDPRAILRQRAVSGR